MVSYQVVYGPPDNPVQHSMTVTEPRAAITPMTSDTVVSVRATNSRGLHGWDWAHLTISR